MINVYGPVGYTGFAVHCKNMVHALSRLSGLTLTVIGTPIGDPTYNQSCALATANMAKFSSKDPSLFIFHEPYSNQCSGTPQFSFSIFEVDRIPTLSYNMLKNGPTDIILATTKIHKDILDSSNIGKPVEILHEGVNQVIFNTIKRSKFIETNNLTFITVGKKEKRKNTDKIIQAFINVCQYKKITLICHTFNPFVQTKSLQEWTDIDIEELGYSPILENEKFTKFTNSCSDIYFTKPYIPTLDLPSLYQSANIGIQCSSGEACDLPAQELLACGIPCIITDCMGHNEYIRNCQNPEDLIIKPTKKEIAKDDIWFKGDSNWDLIEIDSIREKIEYVIKNQSRFIGLDSNISNNTLTQYSWDKAAERFMELVEKYK